LHQISVLTLLSSLLEWYLHLLKIKFFDVNVVNSTRSSILLTYLPDYYLRSILTIILLVLGGVMFIVLAIRHKVLGSKPGRELWGFLKAITIRSITSFGG
jgi:hypothetical protein